VRDIVDSLLEDREKKRADHFRGRPVLPMLGIAKAAVRPIERSVNVKLASNRHPGTVIDSASLAN